MIIKKIWRHLGLWKESTIGTCSTRQALFGPGSSIQHHGRGWWSQCGSCILDQEMLEELLKIKRNPSIFLFWQSMSFLLNELKWIVFLLNSSFGSRWNRVHWHSKRDAEIHPKLSLVSTTGKKIYVTHLITGIFVFPEETTTSIEEFQLYTWRKVSLWVNLCTIFEVFWEVNNAFRRPQDLIGFQFLVCHLKMSIWFDPFKGFLLSFFPNENGGVRWSVLNNFFHKPSRFPRWTFPKPDSCLGRGKHQENIKVQKIRKKFSEEGNFGLILVQVGCYCFSTSSASDDVRMLRLWLWWWVVVEGGWRDTSEQLHHYPFCLCWFQNWIFCPTKDLWHNEIATSLRPTWQITFGTAMPLPILP